MSDETPTCLPANALFCLPLNLVHPVSSSANESHLYEQVNTTSSEDPEDSDEQPEDDDEQPEDDDEQSEDDGKQPMGYPDTFEMDKMTILTATHKVDDLVGCLDHGRANVVETIVFDCAGVIWKCDIKVNFSYDWSNGINNAQSVITNIRINSNECTKNEPDYPRARNICEEVAENHYDYSMYFDHRR